MGFTFRKSFKVAPGLHLNVSKRGMGVSVGGRNTPRVTVNSEGRVTNSVRLAPGLRYQKTSTLGKSKSRKQASAPAHEATEQFSSVESSAPTKQVVREPRSLFLPHSFWSVLFFALAGFISATQQSCDKAAFFIFSCGVVSGITYMWNLKR